MANVPPAIFSPNRRRLGRLRAGFMARDADAARFLAEDFAEDLVDRLAFLRHQSKRVLIAALGHDPLSAALSRQDCEITRADPATFDFEQPWPSAGFDLIALPFVLDTANDLPGALIHARHALAPGGMAFIAMLGAGSLPVLRQAMLAADGDHPAPRLHPQVDVRAGGQLLQRAGYADPMVDSRSLKVRYGRLESLAVDLRAQGLGNALADPGPPLTRSALHRAREAFAEKADDEGRVTETFEILSLSGWRPSAASR